MKTSLRHFTAVFIRSLLCVLWTHTASSQCVSPPSGLISWWRAEDNALDSGLYGNQGILLTTNVTYATGKVGNAFSFNGLSAAVSVGDAPTLQLENFTIECWINRASTTQAASDGPSADALFFSYGTGGYGFGIHSNGYLFLTQVDDGKDDAPSGAVTTTGWTHVAVTQAGTNVIFYVNGTNYPASPYAPSYYFATEAAIGARGDDDQACSFLGAIDELAIYSRALTATEIQSIYNAGSYGKCVPTNDWIPCGSAPGNMVAWWKGESNTYDAISNPGIPEGNVNFAAAEVGLGFLLTNTYAGILVPNAAELQLQTFTIECWIQLVNPSTPSLDTVDGNGLIFSYGDRGYGWGIQPGGTMFLTMVDDSAVYGPTVTTNGWTHVAVTKTNSTVVFYINGAPYTTNYSATFAFDTECAIGARGDDLLCSFYGMIDELSIYSRALTTTEITNIYLAGSAGKGDNPPANLVAWWKGENDTFDSAWQQGVTNGIVDYGIGYVGNSFAISNANSGVCIGNPTSLQLQQFTIEGWIQRADPTLVSKDATYPNGLIFSYGTEGYGFGMHPAGAHPNGTLFLTKVDYSETEGPAITDTLWHHVAVTKAGSNITFYVDVTNTVTQIYDPPFLFPTNAEIGARGDFGYACSFYGFIDELSIYNRALSSNEIANIVADGPGGKCAPYITNQPSTATVPPGATVTFSAGASASAPLSLSYQWQFDGTNIYGATSSSYTITNAGVTNVGSYTVVVNDGYTENISSNALLIINPFAIYDAGVIYPGFTPQNVRLSYWKFDNYYTNQAGTNGALATNYTFFASSFSGSSVSLSNANADLYFPLNSFNCSNGTVRFWFQPNWTTGSNNAPNPDGVLFVVGGGAPGAGQCFELNIENSGRDFLLETFNDLYYVQDYFTSWEDQVHLSNGLWCQIALAYSPTNVALYTNGALYGTMSTALMIWTNVDGIAGWNSYFDLPIGLFPYPISPPYNPYLGVGNNYGAITSGSAGQIDELETFNYPLTAQQIAAGFPTFGGVTNNTSDTNYIGVSDLLQNDVYGTNHPQVRLGYWRFDSSLLYAEQGQMPLWASNVSLSTSWSGTALNVGSSSSGGVAYPSVYTNGWENINCRNGSVRLWYKANASLSGRGELIWLGNHSDGSEWSLEDEGSGTIQFVTATNGGSTTTYFSPAVPISTSNWTQLVLTYTPSNSALYANGTIAATGAGVTSYPGPGDRALGMVIGNTASGTYRNNGQFDEIETFNYPLSSNQILANFQAVTNFDGNLDGIPDVLEEIANATGPQPYLGAPVVVTGTVETEQFDQGGPGVAYHVATNASNGYRQTGMQILSCNDLGGGYCVQQSAGDWADYAINVLVGQPYVIEARVAGVGTGGAFGFGFSATPPYTNNFYATNTNSLTIETTGWTNISCIVYLSNGVNEMRLSFLTNGTNSGGGSTGYVGQFNYISIYPYWPPPTNGPGQIVLGTNAGISTNFLSTNSGWSYASNNAYLIQEAVNSLGTNGGMVVITNGTYYVAEPSPDETGWPWNNAAVTVTQNNVAIVGTGTTNTATTLIGFDRGTTLLVLGVIATNNVANYIPCTNFILSNLTFEAQPHMIAETNSTSGYTNYYEPGDLLRGGFPGTETGSSVYLSGQAPTNNLYGNFSHGILITNCNFLYGDIPLAPNWVSNLTVAGCNFTLWGGSNIFNGMSNGTPNTTNTGGSLAIIANGVLTNAADNFVIVGNTFNGNANTNMLPTNGTPATASTDNSENLAGIGFLWFFSGGNFFIAHNTILNYELEAIQIDAGPNSVVGNTFFTLVSDYASCALAPYASDQQGVTGDNTNLLNYSTTFIGNSVYGGRHAVLGADTTNETATINISGNSITNYPPFNESGDVPGGAVSLGNCRAINMFGNTLGSGGYGFQCYTNSTNIIIANNNFSGAMFGGIEAIGTGFAQGVLVASNVLSQGINYHAYLLSSNSFSWFLYKNQYVNTNNVPVPPVVEPQGSAVHITY